MRWKQARVTATFYVRHKGPGDEYILKGILNAVDEWSLGDVIFQD